MAKVKVRVHNEWFRTVSLGNRKSCPTCSAKLPAGESVWSWGEYVRAKWHTVKHFCVNCFEDQVRKPLVSHAGPCGCQIQLQFRGETQPDWFTLADPRPSEMCLIKSGFQDTLDREHNRDLGYVDLHKTKN